MAANPTLGETKRILLGLIAIELVLVAIHMAGVTLEFQRGTPIKVFHYFDLDEEGNIPAWFSTMQLFAVALLFGVMARWARGDAKTFRPFLWVWALAFLYFSMDEMVRVHETVTFILARDAEDLPHFKDGHGYWIPLYVAIATGLVLIYARRSFAFYRLFPRESRVIAVGVLLFLIGAVGLEIVSYYMAGRNQTLLYGIQVGVEEFLEMFGVSLVLYGTLLLAARALVGVPGARTDALQASRRASHYLAPGE